MNARGQPLPFLDKTWRSLVSRAKLHPPQSPLIADVLLDPQEFGFSGLNMEMMRVIHKTFEEQGITGSVMSRHVFDKLFQAMLAKKMKEELL